MIQWTSIVVSAVTTAGTLGVARAARRTPRQERRDDFTLITSNLRQDLGDLKQEQAAQKRHQAAQDRKIEGQSSAIAYLHGLVRSLVMFTRSAGLEPPAAAPPPDEARPYLHDIGV